MTIGIALVVVGVVALVGFGLTAGQLTAQDHQLEGLPQQNADGTWTPEWFGVGDSNGVKVGIIRTAHMMGDGPYPSPVYSLDDHTIQIGWTGEFGYWALDAVEPWCTGCTRVTEEIGEGETRMLVTETFNHDRTITLTTETTDSDGNTTTVVEIIEEGTDGEEGPTGNTGG